MMKQILFLMLSFVLFSCVDAFRRESFEIIDVTSNIVIPKSYIVTKNTEPIVIDGVANESSWKSASFSENFIDIQGIKQPKFDTKVKMLWDDSYLYVYAEMKEPHIWGNLKQRDTVIFYNNDFEIFIDPSGTGKNYGEIEINALNTVWDLCLDKPYSVGGKAISHWNLNNLKSAVRIYGTLNNPHDIDSLWTVEVAIPLKSLIELTGNLRNSPKEGEQWRINFSRVEWDFDTQNGIYDRKKDGDNTYLPEYNWVWSNQKVINMHEPEKWGFLQFTESSTSDGIEYVNNNDLEIKQVMYALFRKTKQGELKHLLEHDNGYTQDFVVEISKGKSTLTTFYRTHFGFEYKLESPTTQTTYFINEEGVLKLRQDYNANKVDK